jgi:hypothetical protein
MTLLVNWSFKMLGVSQFKGPSAHCLIRKQFHAKTSLIRWNSVHFGRIQKKIKTTQALIDKVQQLPPTSSTFSTESNLKITLEELLLQEETLWKQKSRDTRLTYFDLNTKFFHTSTVIRRRSNAINFLQTREGGWLSDRANIGGSFVTHFANLFASFHLILMMSWLSSSPQSFQMKITIS